MPDAELVAYFAQFGPVVTLTLALTLSLTLSLTFTLTLALAPARGGSARRSRGS